MSTLTHNDVCNVYQIQLTTKQNNNLDPSLNDGKHTKLNTSNVDADPGLVAPIW
jgi:hypothetical protein